MIAELLPNMPIGRLGPVHLGRRQTPLIEAKRRDYVLTGRQGCVRHHRYRSTSSAIYSRTNCGCSSACRSQQQHNWFKGLSGTLEGKRLGIMGTGSIGQHIAKTAKFPRHDRSGIQSIAVPLSLVSIVSCKQIASTNFSKRSITW